MTLLRKSGSGSFRRIKGREFDCVLSRYTASFFENQRQQIKLPRRFFDSCVVLCCAWVRGLFVCFVECVFAFGRGGGGKGGGEEREILRRRKRECKVRAWLCEVTFVCASAQTKSTGILYLTPWAAHPPTFCLFFFFVARPSTQRSLRVNRVPL